MKIIYIITSVCNSSGDNRVLTVKMNYLAEQAGYDVILVTTDQNGCKPFFELSSKIKHLDLGINYNEIPCYSHFFLRFRIPIKTSRFRQALKYHERKLGEIISIEKPDVMVSVNNGVQNFFVGKMKRSFPIIFEYHCALHKERDSALILGDNWKKRILGWCRTRRLLRVSRQYDRVVVLTKEDKTLWEKHNDNIVQIYNPLPFESGEVSKLDKKKLISVGRLTPQKNYGSLIAAWKIVQSKHPDWIIDVWGGGTFEKAVGIADHRKRHTKYFFPQRRN